MYQNIVVPIDLKDHKSIQAVFPAALNFVSNFNSTMHIVHIIPDFSIKFIRDYISSFLFNNNEDESHRMLEEIINQYVPVDVKVQIYIHRGVIVDEVLKYAKGIESELIILPALKPPLRDYTLGANALRIVRQSPISVLVVRD